MTSEAQALLPPTAVPSRTILKLALLLILAGGIAYCNTFTKGFFLDDVLWITNNEKIKSLPEYVSALSSRPVIAVSLYLNYRAHELNAFGYHLVNLAIHLAAAVALFGFVRQTLLLPRWEGRYLESAHWFAFAVALIWVVHPLQTQAVTYVIQRCESMMGLFYLAACYCLARAVQEERAWPWFVGSWACCLLGAGCKEVMVTFIPVMLCYDRIFVASSLSELIKRRWWYYLGVVAIWAVPFAITTLPYLLEASPNTSAGFGIPHLRAPVYWMTQAWVILYYLRLCVFPYPQSFSYRGWQPTTEVQDFWPAGIAVGLIVLVVLWLSWRRHWIGFLGLWFFGILSITSIVPLLDVAFEHRLYLPLAAVSALFVFGGYGLLNWLLRAPLARWVGIGYLSVVVVALTVTTFRRNEDYGNLEAMWNSVLRVFPNDHEALNNLAVGLDDLQKYDEAVEVFKKCPDFVPGMTAYGRILCRMDQPEEGLRVMRHALEVAGNEPSSEDPRGGLNFSNKHYDIGKVTFIQGDLDEAERHFKRAIELTPKQPNAYIGLALVRHQQKRAKEAQELYGAAIGLDEKFAKSRVNSARYMLNGYPKPSQFTRKEALFFAMQAAQAAEYKDSEAVEVLVECLAANGKFADINSTLKIAAAQLSPADQQKLQAATARLIEHYQREAEQKKNAPPPPK